MKTCPQCGSETLPDDTFCGECGHDLRKPKETKPLDYDQPHSYTPKHLADKILTTRSSIEGERKLVTVLFADVAGFTSISKTSILRKSTDHGRLLSDPDGRDPPVRRDDQPVPG